MKKMKRTVKYAAACMSILIISFFSTGCGTSKETMDINYGGAYLIENEGFSKYENLSWKTADENIAAFEDGNEHTGINAVVVGKGPGTTTIDVTNDGKKIVSYTFNVNIVPIDEIVLSTNELEITEDKTAELHYTLLPADASDYGMTWQSADDSIATVSDGVITGIKTGQTTIILSSSDGKIEKCTVTVKQKSAYDRLSDKERSVVDIFMKHMIGFKDPSSIKINGVFDMSDKSSEGFVVNVSGTNGFGGATSGSYMMTDDIFTEIGKWSSIIEWDDSFDVQLITQAIQEKIS